MKISRQPVAANDADTQMPQRRRNLYYDKMQYFVKLEDV